MNDHIPRVSVVMSVYNGTMFLREAVESILNQTFTDFEFIIIDDGSTDGTAQIFDSYADPRIILIKNKQNIGLAASLNKGIAIARGNYIARMDADDISFPDRLARQICFLQKNHEIGVLGTSAQVIGELGNEIGVLQYPIEHHLIEWGICFGSPFVHSTVMIRSDMLRRVGGYSTDILCAEDRDLWQRLSRVAKFCNLRDILIKHRQHGNSVSRKYSSIQKQSDLKIARRMMQQILRRNVPEETVRLLLTRDKFYFPDVYRTANLLSELYYAYTNGYNLKKREKDSIRKEVAHKLYDLSASSPYQMLKFIYLACKLDPVLVSRIVRAITRRMLKSGYSGG